MKRLKNLSIIIICIFLLMSFFSNSYALAQEYYLGDINQDKKINIADELILLRHIHAVKTGQKQNWLLTQDEFIYADICEDDKLDLTDILYVKRYIAASKDNNAAKKHPSWLKFCKKVIIPQEPVNISPTEITLNKTSIELTLEEKVSENLVATILPENANTNTGITWKSENEQIAKVSQTGEVTAVAQGKTTIIVTTQNEKTASCSVKVNPAPVEPTGVKINKTSIELTLEEKVSENLVATILPENANTNTGITWKSENEQIAKVSQTGEVTAIAQGETTITVTTQNGKTASCNVKVNPVPVEPEEIILNKTLINLIVKGKTTEQLTATIKPENVNTNAGIKWNSSDETVAAVSQTGLVTAKTEGKAIITATTDNGKVASCTAMVIQEEASPTVTISKPYEGNVVTAGTTVTYTISVNGNNIKQIDTSKIKLSGNLAGSSKLEITGSGQKYQAKVTVPNEVGTIGIYVDAGMATNISSNANSKVQTGNEYVFTLNETVASNCITVGVGVHNSFYIKDYDFYLNNTKKVGDRTTNEYTYTGLTQGNTYKVKVYITVYKNKTSDDTVSGWLEKSVTVQESKGMEIHFIDVASNTKTGDCIFIKTGEGKTILIDTGADDQENGYANRVAEIDKYLRKSKNSKDGTALVKASSGVVKIDYIVLTHSHIDHIGGFAGLTGVHYQAAFPGYKLDTNNKINGDKVRYEFGKIILGCNTKNYKGDEVLQKDGVNIADGAEGVNTTATAKNKAIYCYANATNKLMKVTAGNVLKVGNTVLNIFWPYPKADLPSAWLSSEESGIRKNVSVTNGSGSEKIYTMTATNNNSIVIKLINGHRKMLLTGDAEFYTEEILLGIPANQVASKSSKLNGGLKVVSSNGGTHNDSVTRTDYTSLMYDLLRKQYGGCTTVEQLESKYKISRLTNKDLQAQILKKGHHDIGNSTSIPFLNIVKPSKIVTTGFSHYADSIVKAVENSTDYRIRKYYNSDYSGVSSGKVELTSSNWYKYVYCTKNDKANKGKGSFYIYTGNGRSWNNTDPNSK